MFRFIFTAELFPFCTTSNVRYAQNIKGLSVRGRPCSAVVEDSVKESELGGEHHDCGKRQKYFLKLFDKKKDKVFPLQTRCGPEGG